MASSSPCGMSYLAAVWVGIQNHPWACWCTWLTWPLISPPSQAVLQAAVRRSPIKCTCVMLGLLLLSSHCFQERVQASKQVCSRPGPHRPFCPPHHSLLPRVHAVTDCLGSSHPPGCSLSPALPYARKSSFGFLCQVLSPLASFPLAP